MTQFQQRFASRDDTLARRVDYDDSVLFVVDLGPSRDASVDVVDGSAIVVVDGDEFEFDIPEGEARASMSNGVVTIEIDQ